MSRFISEALNVALSVAAGNPTIVNPRSPLMLGVAGTFTATVQLQWSPSLEGSIWYPLGSALTAAGVARLPAGRARRVRVNTTAYTSGTPLVTLLHDPALRAVESEREFLESSLEVPASVAAGAAVTLSEGEAAVVALAGTFSATVQVQISLSADGAWIDWGPPLTAAGTVVVPKGHALRVRANTTVYASGAPAGVVTHGFAVEQEPQQLVESVASGPLSLFAETSVLTVTDTAAYSLANGWYVGQRKQVFVGAVGGTPDGTLTPASYADGTSIDLDAVAEAAELAWNGAAWQTVALIGCAINA